VRGIGATPGHGPDRPPNRTASRCSVRRRPRDGTVGRRRPPRGPRRTRGRGWGRRPERGSASLWLLAVGLALVLFSLGAAAVGAARVARHQARVAADLGALAGAGYAASGPDTACARAVTLAAANGGRVVDCVLDGLDLCLTVEVPVEPLPGLLRVASATARAGPVRG